MDMYVYMYVYIYRQLPVCFASGMCSLRLLLFMCSLITGVLCCYSKHKRGGQFGTNSENSVP